MASPAEDPATTAASNAADRGQLLYGRFMRAWLPVVLCLVLIEVVATPLSARPQLLTLVALTAIAGAAVFLAAMALRRERSGRMPLIAAGLVDVAAIATAFISAAGNDTAILLPFLGAVLLVSVLDDRELLAAFAVQWVVGMVGSAVAYGLGELRLAPHADPLVVSLAASGAITFIGYGLLWWVRDRLNRAVEGARKAARAARRSEAALEALIRSSPVPTIGFDLAGVIRTWNPAAEAVFGWRAEEMIGRDAAALASSTSAGGQEDWLARVLAGDVVRGVRVGWRNRAGADVAVDLHAALLVEADGRPTGVVTQAIDETERETLRARIASVERLEAVGQLAGGIAHDFNNLLTSVTGYAELLEASHDAEDPRRGDATEIRRAAERGADLVRQLLAFGRRQPFRPAVVDVNALIGGLLPMLAPTIGAQVRIRTELDPGLCLVRADPGQLEQVIVNLVVNARDAMPDGGLVEIRTTTPEARDSPCARISVSDTGIGMDATTAARAFEPFFTTKGAGRGTGLGLATAYGIVRTHGGSITLRSTPGHGTTFDIDLPGLAAGAAAGAAVPADHDGRTVAGSETILVVDDEAQVRQLAARALGRLGYRVLEAADTASALGVAAAEKGPIDLVLSDVVMPDVRGPALVHELLAVHPEMRVLYMTGYAADGLGGPEPPDLDGPVVEKPFALGELAARVRGVLDAARQA
jgi:PAS domain S-box-containing protein